MPPTKDALYLHIECAKYQFQKWKKALDHHPHLYNPVEYLWAGIDVSLAVQLELLKPAQDAILQFFSRSCKKSECAANHCGCAVVNFPSSDL